MRVSPERIRSALAKNELPDTPLNRYAVTELARQQRGDAGAIEVSAALLASVEKRTGELQQRINAVRGSGDGVGVMKLMTELNQVRAEVRPAADPVTQEREPAVHDLATANGFFNGYLSDQRARFAALLVLRDGLLEKLDQLPVGRSVKLPGDGSAAVGGSDERRLITAERGGLRIELEGSGLLTLRVNDREHWLTMPSLLRRDRSMPPELIFGGNRPSLASCVLIADALAALSGASAGSSARALAHFEARQDERIARYFRATDADGQLRALAERVRTEGHLTCGDSDYTVRIGAAKRAGYGRALVLDCHASGAVHYVDLAALGRGDLDVTGVEGREMWRYRVPARGAPRGLEGQPVFPFAFAIELLSRDAEPKTARKS